MKKQTHQTRKEFVEEYAKIAAQFGIPTETRDGLLLDAYTFIGKMQPARSYPITIRMTADELDALRRICAATRSTKTTVICRLISTAARFMPLADKIGLTPTAPKSRGRVVVRAKYIGPVTPPPPRLTTPQAARLGGFFYSARVFARPLHSSPPRPHCAPFSRPAAAVRWPQNTAFCAA